MVNRETAKKGVFAPKRMDVYERVYHFVQSVITYDIDYCLLIWHDND